MSKPKVLIQIDPDSQASTFDAMVAVDSGIDHLVSRSGVSPDQVEGLVHGAMFTRGPADLKSTALFFGGSNVAESESLIAKAKKCFFGPVRVSLMSDPNGSNTTAAAAVISAEKHLELAGQTITILGGTGPVGQRIAQIIAAATSESSETTTIRICSRRIEKAESVCGQIATTPNVNLVPVQASSHGEAVQAVGDAGVVFAAGAAGVELLPAGWGGAEPTVAIDLNAVPPEGIAGIGVMAKAEKVGNSICYGAIGVGGLKMRIHKRAIEMMFESNEHVLETQEIYRLGKEIQN